MCILLTHSSENGWDERSPKPSTAKSLKFSILLRDLRFVSKLAVFPQDSQIFRIHILLNFKILFLEAYRFQNPEGLDGLKEYALKLFSSICKFYSSLDQAAGNKLKSLLLSRFSEWSSYPTYFILCDFTLFYSLFKYDLGS